MSDKKIEKVISGNVKTRKKSTAKKIADNFIREDIFTVIKCVTSDVIIPSITETIATSLKNGIDMLFGISSRRNDNRRSDSPRVPYVKYWNKPENKPEKKAMTRSDGYDFEEVIFDNRGDAEEVLMRMDEIMSYYGIASVADFYELLGMTSNYTDNNYGWKDIRSARVVRLSKDEYVIKLPRPIPLD